MILAASAVNGGITVLGVSVSAGTLVLAVVCIGIGFWIRGIK